jgi:hypothetical protein
MRVVTALLLVVAFAAPSVGEGAPPFALLLAKAQGRGKVALSAPTLDLHGRIWLYRTGGSSVARARASISCERRTGAGTSGSDTRFGFALEPGGRQELWRYSRDGGMCSVQATVTGNGLLRMSLRGY